MDVVDRATTVLIRGLMDVEVEEEVEKEVGVWVVARPRARPQGTRIAVIVAMVCGVLIERVRGVRDCLPSWACRCREGALEMDVVGIETRFSFFPLSLFCR